MLQGEPGGKRLTSTDFWESYHRSRGVPREALPGIPPFQRLDHLFRAYLPRGRKRLIELGCGSSAWLSYFHCTFGYEVFGLDISSCGCKNARDNAHRLGVGARILQGNLFLAPLRPGTFDVVFSTGLVEHFSMPRDLIEAQSALLRRGGILVTVVPNLLGVDGWLVRHGNPGAYAVHRPIDPPSLVEWARTSGLEPLFEGFVGGMGLFLAMIRHPALPGVFQEMVRRLWRGLHGLLWRTLDRRCHFKESRWLSPFVVCIARKGDE